MPNLPHEQIFEIHDKALNSGLAAKRSLLLSGMSTAYTSLLAIQPDPSSQLLSDLTAMNDVGLIIGQVVPLAVWLRNASYLTIAFPDIQKYFRELADKVLTQYKAPPPAGSPLKTEMVTIKEEIVFVNDMLPFGFLEGARRTGRSVARMTVPCFQNGNPVMNPLGADQKRHLGTGWLIGPQHIITNHHVINSRDDGEPDAQPQDFKMQAENATVEFDYDSENAVSDVKKVADLVAFDKDLDFTILKLADNPGRDPLVLYGRTLFIPENAYESVNVIQHPRGAAKQMSIRNNLVAKLSDQDLAYFTDTKCGSSGSPVCNDTWQVVALHKASTQALGTFKFMGRETAWVNVGTRIDRLITHLKEKQPAIWDAIGALVST